MGCEVTHGRPLSVSNGNEKIPLAVECESTAPLRTPVAPIPECFRMKEFFHFRKNIILETAPGHCNVTQGVGTRLGVA